jgi:MFS family permease
VRATLELFRNERRARVFFAVLAQSALGNGAGYVALLIIAYERFDSAWAIGLVLLADLVPAMLLGPLFGAAADRWSRRKCMVAADVLRAAAFGGIVLVDGFAATAALAVVAGTGTGLFTPAALASVPSLVAPSRTAAAMAVYGAIADIGFILGPAIAAAALLAGGPETLLAANAATFVISGIVLLRLRFGAAPTSEAGDRPSLLRETRQGMGVMLRLSGVRTVVAGSAAMLLFAGLFNVAELPFVRADLGGDDAGFAILVAIYGLGFVGGSLSGGRGGRPLELKRRFLLGLALVSGGFLGAGLAPGVVVATLGFALAGTGNGLILVYERLLIQTTVPDRLLGRAFGVKDGLTAWAFAVAFVAAGGLVEAFGARAVVIAAGIGGGVVSVGSALALRGAWADQTPVASADDSAPPAEQPVAASRLLGPAGAGYGSQAQREPHPR